MENEIKEGIRNLLKKDVLYDHIKRHVSMNCCSCDYMNYCTNYCELFRDGIDRNQNNELDRLKVCNKVFGEKL